MATGTFDEYNIWDNDDDYDGLQGRIIKPRKITPRKMAAIATDITNVLLNQQVAGFIEEWSGNAYICMQDLMSQYKNYCIKQNVECLVKTGQGMAKRLEKFITNGTIMGFKQKNKVYYYKPSALDQNSAIIPSLPKSRRRRRRSKKAFEEEDDDDDAEESAASEESEYEPPPKRRRIDNELITWSAAKEIEKFTFKISILEEERRIQQNQINNLIDICNQQKELISQLSSK